MCHPERAPRARRWSRVGPARVDGRDVHRVFDPGPSRRFASERRLRGKAPVRHPRGARQAAQAGSVHDGGQDGGDGDGRSTDSDRIRRVRRRVRRYVLVHGAAASNIAGRERVRLCTRHAASRGTNGVRGAPQSVGRGWGRRHVRQPRRTRRGFVDFLRRASRSMRRRIGRGEKAVVHGRRRRRLPGVGHGRGRRGGRRELVASRAPPIGRRPSGVRRVVLLGRDGRFIRRRETGRFSSQTSRRRLQRRRRGQERDGRGGARGVVRCPRARRRERCEP
mmetsp:Transcript_5031/g.18908  ORF Transcript_5031/g.18908 Transcript_5031/m.18908 type:complete len:278 (+) Transcript_5031:1793-2626(+)